MSTLTTPLRGSDRQASYNVRCEIDEDGKRTPIRSMDDGTITTPKRTSREPVAKGDNIKVVVRVRPLLRNEIAAKDELSWRTTVDAIVQRPHTEARNKNKALASFAFDRVYDGPNTQTIYDEIGESMITAAMEGYNSTIFAYGETNSGKTYTMKGNTQETGFIPQALKDVFSYIEEYPGREYVLRLSYIEVYNEAIHDLLDPAATKLDIVEHPERGIIVQGIKEQIVTSFDHVMPLIASGEAHRHVGRTNYNSFSSRAHTILQLIIESREAGTTPASTPIVTPSDSPMRTPPNGRSNTSSGYGRKTKTPVKRSGVRISVLNLIDLAGSEKAVDDLSRLREGKFINKSLLTLGTVIMKLSSGNSTHIPYRDSKLTRLLQNSLTGNAKIAIITTINPTKKCFDESKKSLLFAQRAKKIKTEAQINSLDDSILQQYKDEIKALQMKLELYEQGNPRVQQLTEEIAKLKSQGTPMIQELKQKNEELQKTMSDQGAVIPLLRERVAQLTKQILSSTHHTASPHAVGAAGAKHFELRDEVDSHMANIRDQRHNLSHSLTNRSDALGLDYESTGQVEESIALIRLQSADSLTDVDLIKQIGRKDLEIENMKAQLQQEKKDYQRLDLKLREEQTEIHRLNKYLADLTDVLTKKGINLSHEIAPFRFRTESLLSLSDDSL
eukprot:CFRG4846T1